VEATIDPAGPNAAVVERCKEVPVPGDESPTDFAPRAVPDGGGGCKGGGGTPFPSRHAAAVVGQAPHSEVVGSQLTHPPCLIGLR